MTDSHKRIAIDNGTDDIVSGLPRNLIDNILERMPVRDAARTSILSRNWSGPVLKFSLYIPNTHCDWDLHVTQWLLFLSRNGIKELNLDNRNVKSYKLPSYVFSCPELTHLKLRNCVFKPPEVFGGFCNLISLHFEKMVFAANIFGTLVPSVPLLETLNFSGCTGIEHFNIHSPKLKTFFATDSRDVKSISFQSTPNLTMISIVLGKKAENPGQGSTINLNKFLYDLPRILKICFDGFFLKLLAAGPVPWVFSIPFNQLKHLVFTKIRFDDLDQMSCVLCLLRSSPNLKKLRMTASAVRENAVEPNPSYLEAPGFIFQMLNQLRTVKITSITGLRAELLFIKCILACSPFLETMHVQYHQIVDAHEGFRISTELMRFSRASPRAEIIYVKS
ncbi:F-box/FBD/LRR-repeat protein At1g13570-like isoform X2 [Camellia sinensis]|uniref:F-box/FBD/LRR-repeat protein At1g13570-like isoform X2 n=1 Tax=Camellia sinensis TaxID=4442 RepID=UPI0010363D56|nr:F-box/FBD/LRR-repeat protein At1g13570-like isoform X2 [Camellia sinensis]